MLVQLRILRDHHFLDNVRVIDHEKGLEDIEKLNWFYGIVEG